MLAKGEIFPQTLEVSHASGNSSASSHQNNHQEINAELRSARPVAKQDFMLNEQTCSSL